MDKRTPTSCAGFEQAPRGRVINAADRDAIRTAGMTRTDPAGILARHL